MKDLNNRVCKSLLKSQYRSFEDLLEDNDKEQLEIVLIYLQRESLVVASYIVHDRSKVLARYETLAEVPIGDVIPGYDGRITLEQIQVVYSATEMLKRSAQGILSKILDVLKLWRTNDKTRS